MPNSTYMPVQAKGAVFCAEVVPTIGGRTGWADMRAAYDALDDATRAKVEGLAAYHSLHYSQSKLGHETKKADGEYSGYGFHDGPVPLRPLVKIHPETGRKSLLIGRHAHNIPGMDKAESERFLEGLVDFACQPPRTYHHDWTAGRRGDLGQSLPAAPGDAVGHDPAARHVAQPHRRRSAKPRPPSPHKEARRRREEMPRRTTRRDFLKAGTAAATGIVFCSCGLLKSAHAQQAGTRSLPVSINGKRVKTIDIHAHCHFREAGALLGAEAARSRCRRSTAPRRPSSRSTSG